MWSRCRSRYTTTGPEWMFDGSRAEEDKNDLCDVQLEPGDRVDEDNFRRGPATSHQPEPVNDEHVSKKARVARNVLHIRGEDSVKFDVNEEVWPNAEQAIH